MTTPSADLPLSLVRAAALDRPQPVRATTPLGTVDAAAIADVDPAGWVQLRGAEWSLDWWVGAEDRWHHPAQEAAVRQVVLGAAPVLETAMRVPGGDVVQRTYGVRATSSSTDGALWDDSAAVVEVENLTAVPVALAFVLRPLCLDGPGRVGEVRVDGAVVRVDDRVVAVLSRPVARVCHGTLGEVAGQLAEGRDFDPGAPIPAAPDGRLEVALVVPLPHTATVRVLLPRIETRPRRRWFRSGGPVAPGAEFDAPPADSIVKGWSAHTADGARVELAEPLLDPLVAAAARSLVLGSGDHVLDRADRAVAVTELLARTGTAEPLGPLARALADCQRLGGAVTLDDGGDATAALLFAAAPLLATGVERWQEDLLGPVAKSVHLVGKGGALTDASTWRAGSLALALVAPSLVAIGQPEVAEDAAAAAATIAERLATSSAAAGAGGDSAGGAGSAAGDRTADLLGQLEQLRRRLAAGDTEAVAELVELARLGDVVSLGDRYDATGTPSGELGYDPGALAARAAAALDLALLDGVEGPVLLPAWPSAWFGRNVEAHAVRTRFGRASFALRWHGERPAVLWEVEPAPGVDPATVAPVLRCPGLDPSWRGEGWSGEGLMGPLSPPEGLVADEPAAPTIQPRTIDLPAPPDEGQSFS